MGILEQHVENFTKDLQALKNGNHFGQAYDYLVGRGEWKKAMLYANGKWEEPLCRVAKNVCAALKNKLPGEKKKVPYIETNQEEIAFFYSFCFTIVNSDSSFKMQLLDMFVVHSAVATLWSEECFALLSAIAARIQVGMFFA